MIKQCTFIPVKKDLCSDIHHIKTIVITYMYLTHLSIITLVCTCLFSHTRGIPKKSGPSAQFRTIWHFGPDPFSITKVNKCQFKHSENKHAFVLYFFFPNLEILGGSQLKKNTLHLSVF